MLQQQAACLVVFVCTGNTCRSPLAEALCKARLAERLGCTAADLPGRGFHVYSAGLAAMTGGPAAEEAVDVARAYGADLTTHASRPLTADLAAQADYLVAMTRGPPDGPGRTLSRPGGPAAAAQPGRRRPGRPGRLSTVGLRGMRPSDLGLFGAVRRRTPSARVQRLPEWLKSAGIFFRVRPADSSDDRPRLSTG